MDISISQNMIDIRGPEQEVEILYRENCLWVNIDGICRLRIYDCPQAILKLDVERKE